jgi:outer membrane lipoprotein-sorting protein
MRSTRFLFALLSACFAVGKLFAATTENAESIIAKVDANLVYTTQHFTAEMTVTRGTRKLVKKFQGWGAREGAKAFMEFTNLEDRGVKYLKLDNELWIYFPEADDILKISGHLLRQGMMGSDLSYEDMLENEGLRERYAAVRLPDKEVQGRACFVVELSAKYPDLTYARRILAVDKEWFLPLELELFAAGGRKLKTMSYLDVKDFGGRFFPTTMLIRDLRRKESETRIRFMDLAFDAPLPSGVFSKQRLKR